jgi:surfeit locus 1 family protein
VHPATRREGQIEGDVEIKGIARFRADDRPGWFTPANEPENSRWYGYDMNAMEAALGLELLPVVVESDDRPNPGGLPVGGQTRWSLPNDHLGYALTWFGLAAGLAVIYLLFSLRARETPP